MCEIKVKKKKENEGDQTQRGNKGKINRKIT